MAISFNPNYMLIEADSLNRILNNKDVKILDSRWYLNDKRKGLNESSQQQVNKLISESKIVCANCLLKIDNDLIEFI